MSIDDDLALLQAVPSLAVLGTAALRVIAIGAETRQVARGEVLFHIGDPAPAGYVVHNGNFLVTLDNGEEFVAEPGSLFGEMALVIETTRRTTATAMQDATVLRISRNLFQKVLESHPDAALRLRDVLAARSGDVTRDIVAVRTKLG